MSLLMLVKGGEPVGKRGQKFQVNTFRRKQCLAPFQSMKRGFFTPRRRDFRRKNHNRKG